MINYSEVIKNRFHVYPAYSKVIASHGHDFIEFAYVTEGMIEHTVEGNTPEIATKGDFYIVDYNTRHGYKRLDDNKVKIVNFLFYPDFIDRILSGCKCFDDLLDTYALKFSYNTLKNSPTGRVFHDENGRIGEIVSDVVKEYNDREYGSFEYIRCRLIEILILTMRKVGENEVRRETGKITEHIKNYIRNNYAENISLEKFAKEYNYSVSGISKKFKAETGMGFSKYVQRIRIEQSCRLLESTNLSVKEISAKVGYDDVKFFRTAFKSFLKISPLAFRKLRRDM